MTEMLRGQSPTESATDAALAGPDTDESVAHYVGLPISEAMATAVAEGRVLHFGLTKPRADADLRIRVRLDVEGRVTEASRG